MYVNKTRNTHSAHDKQKQCLQNEIEWFLSFNRERMNHEK